MHENREISSTPWSDDQGRSAKATSRTADMHVLEKSDCAVVPVNQPNKGGKPSAEVGEGRARAVENIVQSHMLPTQSGNCISQGMGGVRQAVLPPLIHGKSRMRRRARTDLCGGRSAMVVPTATVIAGSVSGNADCNGDPPPKTSHEIPVAMPTCRYRSRSHSCRAPESCLLVMRSNGGGFRAQFEPRSRSNSFRDGAD